ncbi:MAG: peptidoglycan recognition protein family protein [Planktomarina sp.]
MFQKPNRFVDRVFLHCSASDHDHHDNLATMERWHLERGFNGVGYHIFIRKSGQVEMGRDLERTPAAQRGHNTGTIAISCHGLDERKFTQAQFDQVKALCLAINDAYGGAVTFHGHREVAAKSCPVYDYKTLLKLNNFGQLGLDGAASVGTEDVDSRDPDAMPVIRRGSRGESVKLAQKFLLLKDDGIFGPRTERVVKEFQGNAGLTADGVIGRNSWAALFNQMRIEHIDD